MQSCGIHVLITLNQWSNMPELPKQNSYQFTFEAPDIKNPINSLAFMVVCQASSELEALMITRQKFASVIVEINSRIGALKPKTTETLKIN